MGGYTGSVAVTTVKYAQLNSSNGSVGTWASATSLPAIDEYATSVVANGYLYLLGGDNAVGSPPTSTANVYYIPINFNGTLGASWTSGTSIPIADTQAGSTAYNGYVYEVGGAGTTNTPTAVVNYGAILDPDATPTKIILNGTNAGNLGMGNADLPGAGGIFVQYEEAGYLCTNFSAPNTLNNGGSNELASPFALSFSTNGCGVTTSLGSYLRLMFLIDDSQTASFPDTYGNHTTLSGFQVYYNPSPPSRLRGGETLQNGVLGALNGNP
jgi:hypothetical protein